MAQSAAQCSLECAAKRPARFPVEYVGSTARCPAESATQNAAEYAVERTADCGGTCGAKCGAKCAGMRRETSGGISSEVPRGIFGEVSGGQDCPAFYGIARTMWSATMDRRAGDVEAGRSVVARASWAAAHRRWVVVRTTRRKCDAKCGGQEIQPSGELSNLWASDKMTDGASQGCKSSLRYVLRRQQYSKFAITYTHQ